MATATLTKGDLKEMSVRELRQLVGSQGHRPKKMSKAEMIRWLTDNLTLSETTEAVSPPDPKTNLTDLDASLSSETKQTFLASLATMPPEIQLQWLIKKEELAISLKKEEIAAAERGKERERAHELALRQLDRHMPLDSSNYSWTGHGPPAFKVETAVKLLPKFSEQNVEEYLITFEKMAEIHGWPCDKYAAILHAVLVGKGLKVFAELDTEDCKDYPKLKQALLNAHSAVSEVHRSRFRNRTKQSSETYSDFAFFLAMHCKRWLESEEAFDDIERLREVIKLEQFYERLHPELHSWLIDRKPKTLVEAAKLADEHNAIRKTHFRNQKPSFQSHSVRKV